LFTTGITTLSSEVSGRVRAIEAESDVVIVALAASRLSKDALPLTWPMIRHRTRTRSPTVGSNFGMVTAVFQFVRKDDSVTSWHTWPPGLASAGAASNKAAHAASFIVFICRLLRKRLPLRPHRDSPDSTEASMPLGNERLVRRRGEAQVDLCQ
jgi:hypothetical protein